MMDSSFIEAIVANSRTPDVSEVNGIEHLILPDEQGNWVRVEGLPQKTPLPAPLQLSTLSSLCEYAHSSGRDHVEGGSEVLDLVAHIVDPRHVRLIGPLVGYFRERAVYAEAKAPDLSHQFRFGVFHAQTDFIIGVQIGFEQMEQRDKLLRLAGNLREGFEGLFDDDGVSQTVTVKTSTHLGQVVELENPVALAPYRTFSQVHQPASPFVLRAQGGGEDKIPKLALFEADGGAWKIEAIGTVKEYLEKNLPAGVKVLG